MGNGLVLLGRWIITGSESKEREINKEKGRKLPNFEVLLLEIDIFVGGSILFFMRRRKGLGVTPSLKSRSDGLPHLFVPVGTVFESGGHTWRCVARDGDHHFTEACSGCDARRLGCPSDVACSRFDRADGCNVWFKLVI